MFIKAVQCQTDLITLGLIQSHVTFDRIIKVTKFVARVRPQNPVITVVALINHNIGLDNKKSIMSFA